MDKSSAYIALITAKRRFNLGMRCSTNTHGCDVMFIAIWCYSVGAHAKSGYLPCKLVELKYFIRPNL